MGYTLALKEDYIVCYLYNSVYPRWSRFPGKPDHLSSSTVRMTERPLQLLEYRFKYECEILAKL